LTLIANVSGINYSATLGFVVEHASQASAIDVNVALAQAQELSFSAATDTIASGQSFVFSASLAGASSFAWYLDAGSDAVSTSSTYVASADSLQAGLHTLTATATIGGRTYSGSFCFNVQKSSGTGSLNLIVTRGSLQDLGFAGFKPDSRPVLGPGQVLNLVPNMKDASSFTWYLNDPYHPIASTSTLSLGLSDCRMGANDLTLVATVNGRQYSGSISFDVVNQ
jgi:hypothetical protein